MSLKAAKLPPMRLSVYAATESAHPPTSRKMANLGGRSPRNQIGMFRAGLWGGRQTSQKPMGAAGGVRGFATRPGRQATSRLSGSMRREMWLTQESSKRSRMSPARQRRRGPAA